MEHPMIFRIVLVPDWFLTSLAYLSFGFYPHPLPLKDWRRLSSLVNFQSRTILKDLFTLLAAAGCRAAGGRPAPSSGYWTIQYAKYLWGTCVHSSLGLQKRKKGCFCPFYLAQSTPRASGTLRGGEQRWEPQNKRAMWQLGTQEPPIETERWPGPFRHHHPCFPNWGPQTPRAPGQCAVDGVGLETTGENVCLLT